MNNQHEQRSKQTMSFQTEVKQLLQLMIHSLYSNKEIFLRELVSNASDAIDKLRFEQIKHPQLNHGQELFVELSFDKDQKTITLSDNGIGMSYDEVIENIGTIAKSGTKAFIDQLSGDDKKDANLIGQFGVGFYSAFIVAKQIELTTLKAGLDSSKAVHWVSEGSGEFSIENTTKETSGTTIVLHLKDGNDDLLSDWQLRSLIRKYSDHINYPIKMLKMPEHDEEGKEKAPSTELETVNKANALWVRNKSDITDEEYKEFYRHIAHDYHEPLTWTHSRVEGTQEYTQLLYIPSQAPFDLYDNKRRYGIKLYIKRVFIMDDAEKLLPNYLRFVRGIIDSQDLPLNVSREILQSSKDIDAIRSGATKKVLSLLEDMAKNEPDNYKKFYQEFGNVLKEGVIEDYSNKDRIAKLLRFTSTASGQEQTVTLEEYIARMPSEQDKIYYITAESYNAAKNSPHLEIFNKKDIEVLLLTDKIDEWVVSHLNEFDKKQLVSAASANLDLGKLEDKNEEEQKAQAEKAKPILEKIKTALGEKVQDVNITTRLVHSPSCLVAPNSGMSMHMERLLKQAGQATANTKPTLEINPEHALIKKLDASVDDQETKDLALIIYDQAALTEGMQLEDPAGFVNRMNSLIS
ncbi:MAG: molecular chaperone HtpG [Pseudomonadota bacterium]|nr:molecular chaperone HtpG [Pseudomonadota bacterium]